MLSKAGGRALGAIISKMQNYKDVGFKTYSKMYYSCVVPVTDYCSSIWGFKCYNKIDMTQNKAIRYFMGVHKFAPLLAINGDMGWISTQHRRWVNMLRFWNRLVNMPDYRLTKKIFLYDYDCIGKTWCSDIKSILQQVQMTNYYDSKLPVNLKDVEDALFVKYKTDWCNKVRNVAKLRRYIQCKQYYETENYLLASLTKAERSHLAQFRCGILPIKIETGRYVGLNVNERLCNFCPDNVVEDETHFLLNCSKYNDLRENLLLKCKDKNPEFELMSEVNKLVYAVNYHYVHVSKFLVEAMKRRRMYLYRS